MLACFRLGVVSHGITFGCTKCSNLHCNRRLWLWYGMVVPSICLSMRSRSLWAPRKLRHQEKRNAFRSTQLIELISPTAVFSGPLNFDPCHSWLQNCVLGATSRDIDVKVRCLAMAQAPETSGSSTIPGAQGRLESPNLRLASHICFEMGIVWG
jgi:hypothetical protein